MLTTRTVIKEAKSSLCVIFIVPFYPDYKSLQPKYEEKCDLEE